MKQSLATFAAAFFAASGALFAQDVYSVWKADGSGSWSDASRWVDGNVPSSGGNVLIDGADAYVTDDDYALLKSLTRLRFRNNGSLDMRFDEDHEDFAVNTIMDYSGNASGTLIKSGTGLLVHTGIANGFKVDSFIVTNGTLRIDYAVGSTISSSVIAQNVFGAYGSGVLAFNNSTVPKINGLIGDGTVSNCLSSMQFEFTGGTRENPMVYSGTLGKNIQASFRSGCQYFTKPERTGINTNTRVFGGFVGVSTFGAASGEAGSLGTQDYIVRFQGTGGGVVYLGEGETTSKKFYFDSTPSGEIDAGANGGVTFTGDFDAGSLTRVIPLTLSGDNAERCTIQGGFTGTANPVFPIVKRGSGAWRFSNSARDCIGTVSVEDGTLEYASMAEAGTASSLGTGVKLTRAASASSYDGATKVPWAFCLGTHSTTGTFAYVGSADVACTSRLFSVKGTGVVKSDTSASLFYKGATSFDNEGANTLVLDGSGSLDNFSDVTNGVGSLAIEKRGAGTWTLGGDVTLAGGVVVKEGTLRIANGSYSWFRFTVKKLQDTGSERYLQLKQFRLSAADGSQCNANLTESSETKDMGNNFRLGEGECMWNHGVSLSGDGRVLANLFKSASMVSAQRSGTTKRPAPSDSSTWVSFTFRISDDAKPVAYYDLMTQTGGNNNREPKDWMLEASCDGRTWNVIDTQTDQGVAESGQRWYSSGSTDFDAAHPGYPIASVPAGVTTEIGPVTIAGGMLKAAAPVGVSSLTVDAAAGGAASGLSFASGGVLDIVNAPAGANEFNVPVVLSNYEGSLSRWTLRINGVETTSKTVTITGDGIKVGGMATTIIMR
jgi:autotransporter-associated beta strand protein